MKRTITEMTYVRGRGWAEARLDANLYDIADGRRGSRKAGPFESVYDQLGRMFDHAEWYDWAGTRQPAALIVHPYGHISDGDVQAVVRRYGVSAQIHRPSWWHNPEGQTIVFSAPRDGPRRPRRGMVGGCAK
jgi:hypothetical protein